MSLLPESVSNRLHYIYIYIYTTYIYTVLSTAISRTLMNLSNILEHSNYYPSCRGYQHTQYVQGSGLIPTPTLSIT